MVSARCAPLLDRLLSLISILNICSAGDHFLAASTIYGGTINLFGVTLKRLGIECTFIDTNASPDEIAAQIRPNTRLIFGETLANPALTVFDIEKFAQVAHSHQIPLIVDNTFATPILCRPIEFGADIVTFHYQIPRWACYPGRRRDCRQRELSLG